MNGLLTVNVQEPCESTSADSSSNSSILRVKAIRDVTGRVPSELSFQTGDVIEVTDTSNRAWWKGTLRGKDGYFQVSACVSNARGAVYQRSRLC